MRPFRVVFRTAVALVMLVGVACDSGTSPPITSSPPATGAPGAPSEPISADDFDPANFDDPTRIDNPYFPMQPGMQFTWEGHATEDGKRIRRAVVFTVTDLTKVIEGVRTVVAWDKDYNEGVQEEVELAFFGQDNDGNVWQFGQYPEEYDGREIVKTPTWIAGFQGARPGITMQAVHELGAPSYAQGWGPAVHWNDRAKVDQLGETTCVPFDCYSDVLVIDEFNAEEPGAHQLKYYAPGVGGVRVGWRGAREEEREVLVLVDLVRLNAEQMSRVRRKVLEQEKRAYELSEVYGRTTPIETANVTAEPLDAGGRPWTRMESVPSVSGRGGRTWTALDDFSG